MPLSHRVLALTATLGAAACTQLLGNDFYIHAGDDDGSSENTGGSLNGPGGAQPEGGDAIGGGGVGGMAIGGGGVGGTAVGGTGGTGGGVGGDCSTVDPDPVALDAFMLVDVTGSMTQSNRYATLTKELKSYFSNEIWQPTRVALNFFPVPNATCDGGNWNPPQLGLTDLVAHQALTNALSANAPQGQSSMGAALVSTYDAASAHAAANPNNRVVVVVMADGDINTCQPSDMSSVASVAAMLSSHGIPTYAIVLATDATLTSFDQLAAAGGTSSAHVAPNSSNTAALLQSMRDEIHHCAHRHPFPGAPASELTLFFDNAAVPHVGGPSACGSAPGWYESAGGNTIELCTQTCRSASATSTVSVERCQ